MTPAPETGIPLGQVKRAMGSVAVQPPVVPQRQPQGESDDQLVRRAGAGDQEAFGTLMDRHRDRAVALALRITRSPADAEDVAQQAFVRAWFALGTFRGDSAFGTWLHRIVVRRALDRATAINTRQVHETDLDLAEIPHATSDSGGPDTILRRRLERLMILLTPVQRAAITLYYWEEAPVDEIATALSLPVNTVKTHLRRARTALRRAWQTTEVRR